MASADAVLVTVALPTYNFLMTLAECLASLEAQMFAREHMQIVVGDNGSTDSTLEMSAARFPTVEVAQVAERGSYYERNAAFAQAQGRIACSMDADCVAEPGWVVIMTAGFERLLSSVARLSGRIERYQMRTRMARCQHAWVLQETGGQQAIAHRPLLGTRAKREGHA